MIQKRSLFAVGALSTLTLGIYNIYLVWRWTKDMNGFLGRDKYPSTAALVLGIVSLSLSGCVFESLMALDLEREGRMRGVKDPAIEIGWLVAGLNAVALAVSFTSLWPAAFAVGVGASVLMQRAMNAAADELLLLENARMRGTAPTFTAGADAVHAMHDAVRDRDLR